MLVVGLTLMHHIGGFLRTVEEEEGGEAAGQTPSEDSETDTND